MTTRIRGAVIALMCTALALLAAPGSTSATTINNDTPLDTIEAYERVKVTSEILSENGFDLAGIMPFPTVVYYIWKRSDGTTVAVHASRTGSMSDGVREIMVRKAFPDANSLLYVQCRYLGFGPEGDPMSEVASLNEQTGEDLVFAANRECYAKDVLR